MLVTAPPDEAPQLARALVERRLCACVNLLEGARSFYRWEGEVQDDREALLVIKTTRAAYPELERELPALHPYDLPELICLPVQRGLPDYLAWVASEVGAS